MNDRHKIAVTVITGFLGAGKTTCINQLLKAHPDIQFALVENEFGDVAIDTKLIKGVDASQMFELNEGCICCSITDEYELVLLELAKRFPNVEYLLIETTGVADPAPVIRPFFRDEKLKDIYRYNGTICLVDALNFEKEAAEELKHKQIAVADFIMISKSEKMSSAEKSKLKKHISEMNPLCEIQYTTFGISSQFDFRNITFQPKYLSGFKYGKINHVEITSKTLTFSVPLNRKEFIHWLSYTIDVYKNNIYRIKGLLCFDGEPFEYILQGVGGNYEINEGENFLVNTNSLLILIGKDISEIRYHC